jgi:hypothetical protein
MIETNTTAFVSEKFYDHYLYNLLTLLMKIINECKILNNPKLNETSNFIYG